MPILALLRSCAYLLLMMLATIPFALLIVCLAPVTRPLQRYHVAMQWIRFTHWLGRMVLGIHVRVHGSEHLPQDPHTKVVVLCKHQSAWETLALPVLLPQATAFVFKRELSWIPFFGWGLALCGAIRINRSAKAQAMQQVITQGQWYMTQEQRWVVMFPEGTRVPRFQSGRYKAGGARLAIAVQASILPVALASAKVWPKNRFIKTPGTVDVVFGPLISTEGKTQDAIMTEVRTWIETTMQRIDPAPTATTSSNAA